MKVGRPSRFKRNEIEVRQWFLEHLVDSDGNKISLRDLWWSPEFVEYSGMTGSRKGKKSSNGTLSYWVYKKWGLTDEYVYNYHRNVTFKINLEVDIETWKSTIFKGRNSFLLWTYDEEKAKKVINQIYKDLGEAFRLDKYSDIKLHWKMLEINKAFRNDINTLYKKFRSLYEKLR